MINKTTNPVSFLPLKSTNTPTILGKSILFPSVNQNFKSKSKHYSKSPYQRSALTPPNRPKSFCPEKRPQSNKITSSASGGLVGKKKINQAKKYMNIYSKIKNKRSNEKLNLLQKPFDYSKSFIKKKNPSYGKQAVFDKRHSLLGNTTKAKNQKFSDFDAYHLTLKSQFDMNKTVDVLVQGKSPQAFKDTSPTMKISKFRGLNRPKSMERVKRKTPMAAKSKKISKAKSKKKTRKNKHDISTFSNVKGLVATRSNREFKKGALKVRHEDLKLNPSTSYKSRRMKLDKEIQKLCNSGKSRENKMNTHGGHKTTITSTKSRKKMKEKFPKPLNPKNTQVLSMLTGFTNNDTSLNTSLPIQSQTFPLANMNTQKVSKKSTVYVQKSPVPLISKTLKTQNSYKNPKNPKIIPTFSTKTPPLVTQSDPSHPTSNSAQTHPSSTYLYLFSSPEPGESKKHLPREDLMSFGPLLPSSSNPDTQKTPNSDRKPTAEEEESSLSLRSYENTDEEKEKYYSELELSNNIMGVDKDKLRKKGKHQNFTF